VSVLNVNAISGRRSTVCDLQATSFLSEQAGAIANPRLYETERMHAMRAEPGKEFSALQMDNGVGA